MIAAVRSLIEMAAPHGDVRVVQFSSVDDCEALWSEIEKPSISGDNSTIVLFDGQPLTDRSDTPFRPEHWLSPWDWAIAKSVGLYRNPDIALSSFRCLILDLLPANWGASGRLRFKLLSALMPWIRSYQPTGTFDYPIFFRDLHSLSTLPILSLAEAGTADWGLIPQIWKGFFAAPRDRHAIGNMVGPSLLVEGLHKTRGLSITLSTNSNLRHLHSIVRLASGGGGRVSSFEIEKDSVSVVKTCIVDQLLPADDPFERYRKLRIWLIDDQYRLGYHTVVAHLLFGSDHEETELVESTVAEWTKNSDVRLISTRDPFSLLQAVKKAVVQHARSGPQLLGSGVIDILSLDLRLFEDSTSEAPCLAEKEFLAELIQVCRSAKCEAHSPSMRVAIEAAQRRATGGFEELPSLCLLPLLINVLDPSLPILLFSSTHQREITNAFRNCPSVVTAFAKPIITGYAADDVAKQCAEELAAALKQTIDMHRLRGVWSSICSLGAIVGSKSTAISEPVLRTRDGRSTFTINPSTVAFLASEYQNLFLRGRFADALQLPANMMEHLRAQFDPPRCLKNLDVLFISDLRDPGGGWDQALFRADSEPETREAARDVLEHSLEALGRDAPTRIKQFVRAFMRAVPDLYKSGVINLSAFKQRKRVAVTALISHYASLENMVYVALDRELAAAQANLRELQSDLRPLGSYQFYALLSAMRNARSHFKCRPLEHDAEVEPIAVWLWTFFLGSLQSLAAGSAPIFAKHNSVGVLTDAAARHVFPTANLLDYAEGREFCDHVIRRFGHLLQMGVLDVCPELSACARYAIALAQQGATP